MALGVRAHAEPVSGETSGGQGITLAAAVARTLLDNPGVEGQRQRVEQARGAKQAAEGEFDWVGFAHLYHSTRSDAIHPPPAIATLPDFARTERTVETVGVSRRLGNGITVRPSAALQTEEIDAVGGSAVTRSDIGITFSIPLARGFGRDATEADMRATTIGLEASREQARQEIAARVSRTALAYWRALAATQRLALARDTEARAAGIMESVRGLVEGGEFGSVALDEAKADYLRRKAVRLDATQEVVEARQELGFAMGLNAEEFSAAPTATGDFPGVKAVDWSSEDRKALAVLAMERRGDLGAARLNEQIQEAYLRRARNDLRPLVNLDVRTAYSGSAAGTNYDSVKDTLGNDLDGYNLTVGLSVGWPMGNRFARGEHRRRTAILREAESGTIELRNSVAATVAVATEALQSAVDQHAVAVEASAALARVVESQRSKVSSGEASITALVQNEDRYFEARAAEIQAARAYFSALAKLRLVTGTLVERKEDAYELASNAFEAPPRLP